MTKYFGLIQAGLIALALLFVGLQFVAAYKTQIRNSALDGCASQSSYSLTFQDAEGREVTTREFQKHLYQKCLLDKGLSIK